MLRFQKPRLTRPYLRKKTTYVHPLRNVESKCRRFILILMNTLCSYKQENKYIRGVPVPKNK